MINSKRQGSNGVSKPVSLFDNELLTYLQAASFLKCSRRHVIRLKVSGELPFVLLGERKGVRFMVSDLLNLVQERKIS